MKILIKYFGELEEITKCKDEWIEFEKKNMAEFLQVLYLKYPKLKNCSFSVAQNKKIEKLNTAVSGEEIALLPAFSGG